MVYRELPTWMMNEKQTAVLISIQVDFRTPFVVKCSIACPPDWFAYTEPNGYSCLIPYLAHCYPSTHRIVFNYSLKVALSIFPEFLSYWGHRWYVWWVAVMVHASLNSMLAFSNSTTRQSQHWIPSVAEQHRYHFTCLGTLIDWDLMYHRIGTALIFNSIIDSSSVLSEESSYGSVRAVWLIVQHHFVDERYTKGHQSSVKT